MSEEDKTEDLDDAQWEADWKVIEPSFRSFVEEFKEESDRASVILGASKLDHLLGLMLEKFLLPCPNSSDQLFSHSGPLGTFSSKIDMCYRLGLIDANFARSVHLIRRIRNDFAHELHGAKLNDGRHKDRVKSLVGNYNLSEHFLTIKEVVFNDVEETRAEFSTLLGFLIVRLEAHTMRLESLDSENAVGIHLSNA